MSKNRRATIYFTQMLTSLAGPLWIALSERGLFAIEFEKPETSFQRIILRRSPGSSLQNDPFRTASTCQQISEYFDRKRRAYDLTIDLSGINAFQQQVLLATLAIPHGETATYTEIAAAIGHPAAARAVGRAEATNPIPIVIPCHRIIGSDGKLHGYGGPGGIELKAKLLELETV